MPRNRRPMDPSVKISKNLSKILRHKAEEFGFILMKGGFLYIDDLLKHQSFQGVTQEQIQDIVENNDKQRFTIETDEESRRLKIRANQGHSLQVDDLDLKPITDPLEFPVVVHGTNEKAYNIIQREGLKPMGRNHVHFATGEPGADGVISGMRSSCTVVIYLSLHEAIQDGLQFYVSANNVILCSGNEDRVILPKYFEKVKKRSLGKKQPARLSDEQQAMCESTLGAVSATPITATAVSADDLADDLERQKKTKRKNQNK